jgi:hypothetical protein
MQCERINARWKYILTSTIDGWLNSEESSRVLNSSKNCGTTSFLTQAFPSLCFFAISDSHSRAYGLRNSLNFLASAHAVTYSGVPLANRFGHLHGLGKSGRVELSSGSGDVGDVEWEVDVGGGGDEDRGGGEEEAIVGLTVVGRREAP